MQILDAKIDWYEMFDNNPMPVITLNKLYFLQDFIFQQNGPMYWAEKDGQVQYFYYDGPSDGFGGREFTINVNGSQKTLHGPWSSSSGAMNKYFPHSTECFARTKDSKQLFAIAITIDAAQQIANMTNTYLINVDNEKDFLDGSREQIGNKRGYVYSLLPSRFIKPRTYGRMNNSVHGYKDMLTGELFTKFEFDSLLKQYV